MVKRVLVLEDDPFHRTVLAEGLVDYYEYEADQAEEIDEAEGLLRQHKYDLLALDCVLGGDDDKVLEWARALRQRPDIAETPILFVTAYFDEMKERVSDIPRSAILSKPFTFDEFVAKAEELLAVKMS